MRVMKARNPGNPESARWSAMRMLERRPHSEREIRTKLGRKGYLPDTIDAAVKRLTEHGLIDDAAYARAYARSKLNRKPVGRRLIEAGLGAKGVNRELAKRETGTVLADRDEDAVALAAVRKYLKRRPLKFTGQRSKEAMQERSRLTGWLMRQGFSSDQIRKAMIAAAKVDPDDPD